MNSPATILVVDDNPTNLKLAADVLEYEGHSVLRAGGAKEAQEVLKRSLPDLILMDIQMPGMDGLMVIGFVWRSAERAAPFHSFHCLHEHVLLTWRREAGPGDGCRPLHHQTRARQLNPGRDSRSPDAPRTTPGPKDQESP